MLKTTLCSSSEADPHSFIAVLTRNSNTLCRFQSRCRGSSRAADLDLDVEGCRCPDELVHRRRTTRATSGASTNTGSNRSRSQPRAGAPSSRNRCRHRCRCRCRLLAAHDGRRTCGRLPRRPVRRSTVSRSHPLMGAYTYARPPAARLTRCFARAKLIDRCFARAKLIDRCFARAKLIDRCSLRIFLALYPLTLHLEGCGLFPVVRTAT